MTTNQSVQALCDRTGLAVIDVNFFNNDSRKNVSVTVKDTQSGNIVDIKSVNPHQSTLGKIITGKQILHDGQVIFYVTNNNQIENIIANYPGVSCNTQSGSLTTTPTPSQIAQNTQVTVAPTTSPPQLPSTGAGMDFLFLLIAFIVAGVGFQKLSYRTKTSPRYKLIDQNRNLC